MQILRTSRVLLSPILPYDRRLPTHYPKNSKKQKLRSYSVEIESPGMNKKSLPWQRTTARYERHGLFWSGYRPPGCRNSGPHRGVHFWIAYLLSPVRVDLPSGEPLALKACGFSALDFGVFHGRCVVRERQVSTR